MLFVGTAIGNIRVTDALRSIWPFYIAAFVVLLLVAYVPELKGVEKGYTTCQFGDFVSAEVYFEQD